MNVVLDKSKKKRKKGRLPSDDSMYRDTIEIKEEDNEGELLIDEQAKQIDAKTHNGKLNLPFIYLHTFRELQIIFKISALYH